MDPALPAFRASTSVVAAGVVAIIGGSFAAISILASFFIISRIAYEKVGTHESVKQELVEDGALGGKVKDAKFRLKMVRGEENITAIWARDLSSLWHGMRSLERECRIGRGGSSWSRHLRLASLRLPLRESGVCCKEYSPPREAGLRAGSVGLAG